MKTVYKKLCLLAMVIFAMAMLTGCSSPKATYEKAQDLLAKGKYAQAAEKFESLGSYEEASTLAMYCKACALCEEGNYSLGIDAFEMLGNYKDCAYRINYYSARSWDDTSVNTTDFESMERAKTIYSKNPLYLDSADRITALDKRIAKAKNTLYDGAQKEAKKGQFSSAISTFKRLGNYMDSANRAKYYAIRADEEARVASTDQDAVLAIAERYTNMGSFLDSASRASSLTAKADKIVADKYAKVQTLTAAGKCDEAEAVLSAFGRYGNEQVNANYYAIAEKYLELGEYDAAAAAFKKAGKYSDAKTCITYCDIRKAEAALGDTTDMSAIQKIADRYTKLGTVQDSVQRAAALEERITASKYDAAMALKDAGKYSEAITAFTAIKTHKDSAAQIKACETAILDGKYDAAMALMNAGKYSEAITAFTAIKTHKDSAAQIKACETAITAILDGKYDAAMALKDAGKYSEAITAFTAIKTHKDSAAQIKACETAILDGKYDAAMALKDAGKYSEAITAFTAIKTHRDSEEQVKACEMGILDDKYDVAMALKDAGKYADAYEAFVALNGHKDSAAQASAIAGKALAEKLNKATVGSYITFGTYEQDSKTSNGKEAIEWLVLAKENNRMLVISRYALDCQPYNTTRTNVTWEKSTLRTWLNKDFLNAAFSSVEQAMIPTVTVSADKNPSYSTDPGKATQDKVFLLSIVEANKYFKTDSARKCQPTAYAKAQGAYENGVGFGLWWLRSPGSNQDRAAYVYSDGGVLGRGYNVSAQYAVRPALWINLEP